MSAVLKPELFYPTTTIEDEPSSTGTNERAANRLDLKSVANAPRFDTIGVPGGSSNSLWESPPDEDLHNTLITDKGWRNYSPTAVKLKLTLPSFKQQQVLLAEWNGYVTAVEPSHFVASLKGIFGEGIQGGVEEDAEIPISDVGKHDANLLRPGSYFRLCVFYELDEDDRPRRYTKVIFRRLPAYRTETLARAAERGADLHRKLRVE